MRDADYFNLPKSRRGSFRYWGGTNAVNLGQWHSFSIPRGASMAYLLCLGGGAGGGGGQSSATGVVGGGGGGGGSGARALLIIPTLMLPPVLYVSPGAGGAGGAASGGNATAGVKSFICDKPFTGATTLQDVVLVSGHTAAAATGAMIQPT